MSDEEYADAVDKINKDQRCRNQEAQQKAKHDEQRDRESMKKHRGW